MNITLSPETLFKIGEISVTNTLFTAFVVVGLILFLFIIVQLSLKRRNPSKFLLAIEMMIEFLWDSAKNILGEKLGKRFFGFLFTFFIFILFSNWFGLLPFVSTFGVIHTNKDESVQSTFALVDKVSAESDTTISINDEPKVENINIGDCITAKDCYLTSNGIVKSEELKHVFRAPTSDLSLTIAFALISVFVVNAVGVLVLRGEYIKKYFNFTNAIDGVVGILEIVSEIGKIISFSFRLFGNVFAGEVLISVITMLTFGIATLPFLGLELFVGVIQAFVFFMLTAVFLSLATTSHDAH